jgi:hypothetical protein
LLVVLLDANLIGIFVRLEGGRKLTRLLNMSSGRTHPRECFVCPFNLQCQLEPEVCLLPPKEPP